MTKDEITKKTLSETLIKVNKYSLSRHEKYFSWLKNILTISVGLLGILVSLDRAFNTIANTISLNYRSILNYFINRSTNASAESFNAKIKAFRAQFRGVKNVEFFLYRLTTIFA